LGSVLKRLSSDPYSLALIPYFIIVSHYEFIKYHTRLLVTINIRVYCSTGTHLLFFHSHQSKQKSFAPPEFANALPKISGWHGYQSRWTEIIRT